MTGLAHRGWTLADYGHHIVHPLREAGYWSALIGEQHLSADPGRHRLRPRRRDRHHPGRTRSRRRRGSCSAAGRRSRSSCRSASSRPTATTSSRPRCATRCTARRPRTCPTRPRRAPTWPPFKASARSLDQGVGAVLHALDEPGLADDTLVILTTDHGLPFPGAKATLTDRGLGVMLIMRGPGRLSRRPRHRRAGLAGRPLPDAAASSPGAPLPDGLHGQLAAAARPPARSARSATSCSPSSPSTPPTSRSARSAPSATSTSAASATASSRCSRTSTTRRPRTC